MTNSKTYHNFNPNTGYPKGKSLFYECLRCGNIIPSQPKDYIECACRNIAIDVGYGRIIVKDNKMIKLFSEHR